MTTTGHDDHNPTDQAWDNRRLLLASLAPRTTTRPARRGSAPASAETSEQAPAKPSLLHRSVTAAARTGQAARRRFNKAVPPDRRGHAAVIAAAVLVVLVVAVSVVRALSADIAPAPAVATPTPTPSEPTHAPLAHSTILTGATADDLCPRDANYSPANNALDGDFTTAWTCTRLKNENGQVFQINFHRQVTLEQVAMIQASAQSKHRIVTKAEIWFPKELHRDPIPIITNGVLDDWVPVNIEPPAVVTQLLLRIEETDAPPQIPSSATETTEPAADDEITTVTMTDLRFVGTSQT